MFLQRTIKQRVRVEGVGLHSGEKTAITFCPAPVDTGVYFIRGDLANRPYLSVNAALVKATNLATTLGCEDFSVGTVEHCLSTLAALRIDNIFIEVEGLEIPIADGSALPFLDAISKTGIVEQDQPRRYLYITHPIRLGNEDKYAYVLPYNGLRVTCTIDFSHPCIGTQFLDLDINEDSFRRQIAPARTFGFMKDVEVLKAKGLIHGGSLENAIVLDEEKILNPEGLRFKDEFVRHKILDALGDIVNLGNPLMGHLVLYKSGHELLNQLVQTVLANQQSHRLVELGAELF